MINNQIDAIKDNEQYQKDLILKGNLQKIIRQDDETNQAIEYANQALNGNPLADPKLKEEYKRMT